jgi:hypothetical protein
MILSPVDRKFSRLLRGNDLARIIPPHEFSRDEWEIIMREHHIPALLDFARSLDLPSSEMEWVERQCILAMLPYFQAGLLQSGAVQTFTNKDTYGTAQTATVYAVNGIAFLLIVKGWGAGGGATGNFGGLAALGGDGGGGGFAGGTINVTPGESLSLDVGAGGVGLNAIGAGGGGYTALKRSSTFLMQAGGGGGGGSANGGTNAGGDGGPGSGGNGLDGTDASPSGGAHGSGATTSAGGAGGTGTGGLDGTAGSANLGGNGAGQSVTGTGNAGGAPGGGAGGTYASQLGGGGGAAVPLAAAAASSARAASLAAAAAAVLGSSLAHQLRQRPEPAPRPETTPTPIIPAQPALARPATRAQPAALPEIPDVSSSSGKGNMLVQDFSIWRQGYNGATVTIYQAGTTNLATLYSDENCTVVTLNPQKLTSETRNGVLGGKFTAPVYVNEAYEWSADGGDTSGVIFPPIVDLDAEDVSGSVVTATGGSVSHTIKDIVARTIYALDYGALGATAATNTATLNAAAGIAAGQGGGRVMIPDGTYPLTSLPTAGLGVIFEGEGRGVTVLQCQTADKVFQISGDRAGLKNLTLDGVNNVAGGIGIYAKATDEMLLCDIEVKNFETGIYLQGGRRLRWRDVYIDACGRGVRWVGDSDASHGADGDQLSDAQWIGGLVTNCTTSGLELEYEDRTVPRQFAALGRFRGQHWNRHQDPRSPDHAPGRVLVGWKHRRS